MVSRSRHKPIQGCRKVGNPRGVGASTTMVGILCPLVGIGSSDLPKSGAIATHPSYGPESIKYEWLEMHPSAQCEKKQKKIWHFKTANSCIYVAQWGHSLCVAALQFFLNFLEIKKH